MPEARVSDLFGRIDRMEVRWCQQLNHSSQYTYVRIFFRAISRLGDGIFWYSLLALLPYINGSYGFYQVIHIILTALCVLIIYKYLKQTLIRERPCISFEHIHQAAPALDRYSFPSGHTMHAFSFALMFSFYLPSISALVWTFAILVAMSRVILGLHYLTDVLAGIFLGTLLAATSLMLISL